MDDIPILYCKKYRYILSLELKDDMRIVYRYEYKGKYYIGQTNNLKRRHWDHHGNSKRSRQIINDILDKHREIIPVIIWIGRTEDVDDAERFYIDLFHSRYPDGYNYESGGNLYKNHSEYSKELLRKSHIRPVLQYTKEGKFVKEYPSQMSACIELGKKTLNGLSACLNGHKKSSGGYQWRYRTSDDYPLSIDPVPKTIYHWTEEEIERKKERMRKFRANMTDEQKARWKESQNRSHPRGENHPFYGKKRPPEVIAKMVEGNKRYWDSLTDEEKHDKISLMIQGRYVDKEA